MNFIRNICVYYLLAWPLTPPLRVGTCWRILFVLAFLGFLFTAANALSRRLQLCFATTAVYTCFVTMLWLRYGELQWPVFIATFIYYAFSFIFIYYWEVGFDKFKSCFWVLLASFTFWNFTTILALIADPSICRRLGNSGDDLSTVKLSTMELLMTGGFATIYCAVLLIPRMLDLLVVGKNPVGLSVPRKEKIVALAFLSTGLVAVVLASYSIAFFVLCLGIGLWFLRKKLSFSVLILVGIVATLIFFATKDLIYDLLLYFAGDNLFYVNKIEALFNPMSSRTEADARFIRWSKSFNSFLKNPVFGGGESGGHSGILDLLGLYGGILCSGMIWLFFLPFVALWKKMKTVGTKGILIAAWVPFALLLLLNPLQFAYAVVVFAIFPYIATQYYLPRPSNQMSANLVKFSR